MDPENNSAPRGSEAWFVTTHWSVVLSAQDKACARSSEALEALCRTYWYPLYAYARRVGQSPADAEDLTQGFFARLLEKNYLNAVAPEHGRFRTFLLTALKRYMANEWDRQHAAKRGGFAAVVPIDQTIAETRFAADAAHQVPPDILFDRHWALTLLERTMSRLQQEYVASSRARLFEALRSSLTKEDSALPHSEIGAQLGLTEAAVKMALHRLRARYREILLEEIGQTVTSPTDLDEEVRQLFSAFGP